MLSYRRRLTLGLLALTSMLLSIAVQWKIITGLGAGAMTDAYFAAMVVPTVLMVIIGSSVSHVLVPFLIDMAPGERQVNTWGLLLVFMGIFGVLAILLSFTAQWWVGWLFPGFSAELTSLTVTLVRIMSFILLFGGLSLVLAAVHQSEHHFLLPEVWTLVTTLLMFIGVMLGLATYGILLVAWLTLLRHVLQSFGLLARIPRPDLHGFSTATLAELWRRARPLLAGSSIYKTGPVIDRYLASMTPVGGITLIAFAQQLYGLVLSLADKAFATPLIAITSTLSKQGEHARVRRMYRRLWGGSLVLSLLVWAGIALAGEQALTLFLGYGFVKPEDIATLSTIMIIMGGLLAGGITGQLSAAGLYACKKSSDVARIAVINFIIATIIKIVGFMYLGLYGIVIGIVAYQVINAIVLHIKLERTYREDYA